MDWEVFRDHRDVWIELFRDDRDVWIERCLETIEMYEFRGV